MKGKLIVIEGTDCSGKETQSNLLIEKLKKENIRIEKFSFPNYNSPTGKIIGGPYLGKSYICEGWFEEGAPNVDPKVSALYYAADRLYNIDKINFLLENGVNVILDRYVFSNMAHQGGKIEDKNKRNEMYEWLENLEFNLLNLPKPDIGVFLHMPFECSLELKKNREEELDQNEKDRNHLINAENAYKEVAKKYNFYTIECNEGIRIKTIEEINEDLYNHVISKIKAD
jgi:dTMP kinase